MIRLLSISTLFSLQLTLVAPLQLWHVHEHCHEHDHSTHHDESGAELDEYCDLCESIATLSATATRSSEVLQGNAGKPILTKPAECERPTARTRFQERAPPQPA